MGVDIPYLVGRLRAAQADLRAIHHEAHEQWVRGDGQLYADVRDHVTCAFRDVERAVCKITGADYGPGEPIP